MAYYGDGPWSPAGRTSTSWEQPAPPSRSGASSVTSRDDATAFGAQFEEVDRATDNLMKSGKMFGLGNSSRRDSMPMVGGGRPFSEFGGENRSMGMPQRHHSVSEYDGGRPLSASNLQGYYASQRFGPRPNETDQMMQAKRRMAAQRERDLRNYHQEQQYTRNVSGPKSDRSMSPNTGMSEDERRALIARQHQALYGADSTLYAGDGTGQRSSQDARVGNTSAGGPRGPSPLAFDPFGGMPQSASADGAVQMPPRDQMSSKDVSQRSRANSTSSPSSNPTTSAGFNNLFETAQQSSRTSASSPGGSPPRQGGKPGTSAVGVAPIGTRPNQTSAAQNANSSLGKRSTTPLPSPLSYGFTASEQNNGNTSTANSSSNNNAVSNNGNGNNGSVGANGNNSNSSNNNGNDRSTSSSSNPSSSVADKGVSGLGWGSNSGVWGTSKGTLGVQASVWG